MNNTLRVLLVEDNEMDAQLMLRELRKTGLELDVRRAQTAAEFQTALAAHPFDLVVADYSLPAFSGMEALRLLRASGSDVPFILISGKIGEELAVEAMRHGAQDYLLKGNLDRLAPAVERELREAEERRERRHSEERYRSIFESIQDVYYETTPEGVILEISESAREMFGLSPAELAGRNTVSFYANTADRDRLFQALQAHGRVRDFEVTLLTGRGKSFHASTSCQLVRDEAGVPVRVRGVLRDISERKRAEESRLRLEAQLRQAQKMEAIGTLAGGIAHDFNNMLTAIMGHAELLRLDCTHIPNVMDSVEEILKAAHRARELVQQILTFSRRREQKRVVTQLGPIIKEACKLLRSSIPSTIEMQCRIEDTPPVLADPTQIHQVVLNLCTNAAQAMAGQTGRLELALAVEAVDAAEASQHRSLQPRRYVVLTVRDTGCGMDFATLDRVFDPFFTTKPPGEGTGLGLAVVHAIVEAHEGAITIESKPGVGSAFRVYLPVIEAETAPPPAGKPAIPQGHNEEILVVDDEPPVLQIADRLLSRLGYRAVCFNRPADALAAFETAPNRFALVMADLTMPKMTGLELAQRLHKINPQVPIILVSGMGGSITDETARQLGFRMLLPKPYEYVALAEALAVNLAPGPKAAAGKTSP